MSAVLPSKLGVIAGSGVLPGALLAACDEAGIETFVVAFGGRTDPAILESREHMITRIGAAGTIIKTLKAHGVYDLVMIGAIRRPKVRELRPDLRTICFFARIGFRVLGDDGLLKALRRELESEGFRIHGVQSFIPSLVPGPGPVGHHAPGAEEIEDIARGMEAARLLGARDAGQAVVVRRGLILGEEGPDGTDALIRRCAGDARGALLVKACKPGQDRDLDLPAIGPHTVELCAQAGFAGIAFTAGAALLVEAEQVARLADRHGLFVVGV